MSMIWATRGRTWGFRFLRRGGYDDPLPIYEECFPVGMTALPSVRRVHDRIAVRFADPDGRQDRSGRVIVHEFILDSDDARKVDDVDDLDGIEQTIWAEVRDEFDAVWDQPVPPRT